jgi:PTS system N-acetylglucosamine-specific IIC component
VRFDLKTPGRDRSETLPGPAAAAPAAGVLAWVAALGGATNLRSVDACTTRLRLTVVDQSAVDADALKRLGARGVVRPTSEALQVVVGTVADQLAGEIRGALQGGPASEAASGSAVPAVSAAAANKATAGTAAPSGPRPPPWQGDGARLLAALGGRSNVRGVETAASRLRVSVADEALRDRSALGSLGLRGVATPLKGCVHLIVGPAAAGAALQQLLQPPK